MKAFTTTGVCTKENNYMVDITDRLVKMKAMVDAGNYFTVTRARQYGKTTTLNALYYYLQDDYIVINLSFEGIGDAGFSSEQTFVKAFCRKLKRETRAGLVIPDNIKIQIDDFLSRTEEQAQLDELFDTLYDWCYESEKEIVLFIDEVDSATNNQVFLDFLAQLRDGYLRRQSRGIPTFKSVILAGVTDIKSLKRKNRKAPSLNKKKSADDIREYFIHDGMVIDTNDLALYEAITVDSLKDFLSRMLTNGNIHEYVMKTQK